MIRKIGYKIGKLQANNPYAFVALAIILTLITLPGIPMLLKNVEPSLEKVLPQEIEEVKIMNDMRSQYGADMLYLVLSIDQSNNDIYSKSSLDYIDSLSQSLQLIDNVRQVNSISDVVKQNNNELIPYEKNAIISSLKNDPRASQYVNADRSISVIMIRTDTGASAKTVTRVIDDIKLAQDLLEPKNPGFKAQLTGFNAIDNVTFSIIISDFSKITVVSFALMVIFLLIYYKFNIKKTVYSMVIMLLSLIWALGVTGYLGIQLNVVTMVAAAMIMALGSSYGINSVYHFYDDFLIQYPKKEAIAKFQEFLILGLSGSAFAEIAGFAALLFGIMPSMRSLGIILGIGIFFALFVSVVILPAFFFIFEEDSPTAVKGAKHIY